MKRQATTLTVLALMGWAATSAIALESLHGDKVVSVTTGDWNKDGNEDAAIVTSPGDGGEEFGISIYLKNRPDGRLILAFERVEFLWGADTLAGQEPSVEATSNGSLIITTKNDAIGRNRWRQNLTVAYRDEAFVVAGFTYTHFDTLEPKESGPDKCDLNLLSGRGFVNGKEIKFNAQKAQLADWRDDIGLKICGII